MKTHVSLVHADRNTPGFMRSPPVVPYIYTLESAMDELAVKLDMDPVELRRVNDAMHDATGKEWSSRSLMKCYDEAASRFGWSKRDAKPGSMRDGSIFHENHPDYIASGLNPARTFERSHSRRGPDPFQWFLTI